MVITTKAHRLLAVCLSVISPRENPYTNPKTSGNNMTAIKLLVIQ